MHVRLGLISTYMGTSGTDWRERSALCLHYLVLRIGTWKNFSQLRLGTYILTYLTYCPVNLEVGGRCRYMVST